MAGFGENDKAAGDDNAGGFNPKDKQAGSGFERAVVDPLLAAAKGTIAVPEAAVGVADLVTGGKAGKLAEAAGFRPKEAKQFLSDLQTPDLNAARERVGAAEGFFPTVGAALQNPSTIVDSAVESLPLMGAGGVIGRGVVAAVPRISSAVAGAIGEGVTAAGQNTEQVRQETADGELTAKQAALTGATGFTTGVISGASAKLANRLGISDAETALVRGKLGPVTNAADDVIERGGVKFARQADGSYLSPSGVVLKQDEKSVARKIGEGIVNEGLLEEAPQSATEQVLQNLAQDKNWSEGVGNAAGMGFVTGGAMGGVVAPLGHGSPDHPAPAPTPQDRPAPTLLPGPGYVPPNTTLVVDPEGNVGTAAQQDLATRNSAELGTLARAVRNQRDVTDVEAKAPATAPGTPPAPPAPPAGPSAASMGIDAAAGGLQAAATVAVDTGAHQANADAAKGSEGTFPNAIDAQRALTASGLPGKVTRSDGGWRITTDKPADETQGSGTQPAGPETTQAVGSGPTARQVPGAPAPAATQTDGVAPAKAAWQAFPPDIESLGVPRTDMPQIKSSTHGPLTQFLTARGITHEVGTVDPTTLKPTQAEYSPEKIKGAQSFEGPDKAILTSSDGYILDGHHQWLARYGDGQPVKTIRFNAPIAQLLPLAKEFPSASTDTSSAGGPDAAAGTQGTAAAAPDVPAAPAGGRGTDAPAGDQPGPTGAASAQPPAAVAPQKQPELTGKPDSASPAAAKAQADLHAALGDLGGLMGKVTNPAAAAPVSPQTAPSPSVEKVTSSPAAAPVSSIPATDVRYGRDGTPLHEGGKPFKNKLSAQGQQKNQPGTRIVKVEGGYALRDLSAPERAATNANNKKRQAASRKASWEKNPLLHFLGQHGLFHVKSDAKSLKREFSPDANPAVHGFGSVFRRDGQSIDALLPIAIQDGFLPQGADERQLEELITRVMRGERIAPLYSADGAATEAERQAPDTSDVASASFDELMAADKEDPFDPSTWLDDEDLQAADYDKLTAEQQSEFRALIALADSMGIDSEGIREEAARRTSTELAYYEAARSLLEEAVAASAGRGSSGTGEQGQAHGTQAEAGQVIPPAPDAAPSSSSQQIEASAAPQPGGTAQRDGGLFGEELQQRDAEDRALLEAARQKRSDTAQKKRDDIIQGILNDPPWKGSPFEERINAALNSLLPGFPKTKPYFDAMVAGFNLDSKTPQGIREQGVAHREDVARKALANTEGEGKPVDWEKVTATKLRLQDPSLRALPMELLDAAAEKLNELGPKLAALGFKDYHEVHGNAPAAAREAAQALRDVVQSLMLLGNARYRSAKGHRNTTPERLAERLAEFEDSASKRLGINTRDFPGIDTSVALTAAGERQKPAGKAKKVSPEEAIAAPAPEAAPKNEPYDPDAYRQRTQAILDRGEFLKLDDTYAKDYEWSDDNDAPAKEGDGRRFLFNSPKGWVQIDLTFPKARSSAKAKGSWYVPFGSAAHGSSISSTGFHSLLGGWDVDAAKAEPRAAAKAIMEDLQAARDAELAKASRKRKKAEPKADAAPKKLGDKMKAAKAGKELPPLSEGAIARTAAGQALADRFKLKDHAPHAVNVWGRALDATDTEDRGRRVELSVVREGKSEAPMFRVVWTPSAADVDANVFQHTTQASTPEAAATQIQRILDGWTPKGWPALEQLIEQYDGTGELSTPQDVMNEVEGLIGTEAPSSLQDAVDAFAHDIEEDRVEFGGRGDLDTSGETFINAVKAAIADGKKAAEEPWRDELSAKMKPAEPVSLGDKMRAAKAETEKPADAPAAGGDLFGAAPNASQQAANKLRAAKAEKERRQLQNAPSADGFAMAGSDRQRDIGAAAGQQDLPGAPEPVAKPGDAPPLAEAQRRYAETAHDIMETMGVRAQGISALDPELLARAVRVFNSVVDDFAEDGLHLADMGSEADTPGTLKPAYRTAYNLARYLHLLRDGLIDQAEGKGSSATFEAARNNLKTILGKDAIPLMRLVPLLPTVTADTVVNDKPRDPTTASKEESLLFMPCSDEKNIVAGGKNTAGATYKGVMWQTLRAHALPSGATAPEMLILSAKYGVMHPGKMISDYNEKLTAARVDELVSQAADIAAKQPDGPKGPYRDVQIAGGADYRAVMRAVVAEMQRIGKVAPDASIRETKGAIGMQRQQLGRYLDGFKQADAEGETPAVSASQARKQFEWRNLGQKDGVKTHGLFFFEKAEDKGTGRSMGQGLITQAEGSSWETPNGERFKALADAKRATEDAAIANLRDNGYVGDTEAETLERTTGDQRPDAEIRADLEGLRELEKETRQALADGTDPVRPGIKPSKARIKELQDRHAAQLLDIAIDEAQLELRATAGDGRTPRERWEQGTPAQRAVMLNTLGRPDLHADGKGGIGGFTSVPWDKLSDNLRASLQAKAGLQPEAKPKQGPTPQVPAAPKAMPTATVDKDGNHPLGDKASITSEQLATTQAQLPAGYTLAANYSNPGAPYPTMALYAPDFSIVKGGIPQSPEGLAQGLQQAKDDAANPPTIHDVRVGQRVEWKDFFDKTEVGTVTKIDPADPAKRKPAMVHTIGDSGVGGSMKQLRDVSPSDAPSTVKAKGTSHKDKLSLAYDRARRSLQSAADKATAAGADKLANRLQYLAGLARPSTNSATIAPAHAEAIVKKLPELLARAKLDPTDDFYDVTSDTTGRRASPEEKKAKADLLSALGDLGNLLHNKAGGKLFITPEQEQALLPILSRVFDAAFRLGAIKFKQASKFVLDQIRTALGEDVADAITIDHLQGAYISMAGKYREQGADTAKSVVGVESKAEIEAEPLYVPGTSSSVERDSGEPAAQPGVGADLPGDAIDDGAPAGDAADQPRTDVHQGPEGAAVLPAGGPLVVGVGGDQRVPAGSESAGPESVPPGGELDQRGDEARIDGVPIEPAAGGAARPDAAAGAGEAGKRILQRRAQGVAVKPGDLDNIREALPYLLPGQQEDVQKAETRHGKPDGYGMLFTNGTGTGKTFSGLGIVKRAERAGNTDTLIVVPDEKIGDDWIASGQPMMLDIKRLADTKTAGEGVVITTYANLGQNDELAGRDWKNVVVDESHMLMQSADGDVTLYLQRLRAITHHPDGAHTRFEMLNREDLARAKELRDQIKANDDVHALDDTTDAQRAGLKAKNEKLKAILGPLQAKLDAAKEAVDADVAAKQGAPRARVTFLSATPFAYEETVDWGQGYLYDYRADYPHTETSRGYNTPDPKGYFFIQHFGWRMRYGKLTQPDAKVDRGLMQRQFNSWLKKQGVLSSRQLEVPVDYDRRFIAVSNAIGNRIDEALEFLSDKSYGDDKVEGMSAVRDHIDDAFDYLTRRYLLEAIKAKEAVPIVKQHLALGRKVVVFHDYNKGGGTNPFDFAPVTVPTEPKKGQTAEEFARMQARAEAFNTARDVFREAHPDLVGADFARLTSPIVTFSNAFDKELLLINGLEKKADVLRAYQTFQDDGAGPMVALVQADKNKGWSGHDTTGKHQRVLMNLGLPTQPTRAIQQEGRILRTGSVSDAIFRYLNTGTSWERWAFATTIAERASTAENLSMGEQARALKDAYISAFEEADKFTPGHEGEGKGGKERDRQAQAALSEFDRAKAFYFGTQKKTSKTKAQEGKDYFATPEPVGLKMVEWANARGGEDVLEPSAGHGAIARWFPENANRTAIEPSSQLRSRLGMVFDGKIVDGTFEDFNVVNKFDAIVMNPPFGVGGSLAIPHLAKAATHLRDGGRLVALLPRGPMADKRLEKFLYEAPAKPLGTTGTVGDYYAGDVVRLNGYDEGRYRIEGVDERGVRVSSMTSPGKELHMRSHYFAEIVEKGSRTAASDLNLLADIDLPSVTFERAGTGTMAHIIVLQKGKSAGMQTIQRDLTDIDDINKLFDRVEALHLPERPDKVDAPSPQDTRAPTPAQAAAASLPPADPSQIVEVTTSKGKVLRGVIRADLTKEQAKAIDPFTWKPAGFDGFFIREKYLQGGNTAQEERAVYAINEPGSAYDIDLFPATLEGLQQDRTQPQRRVRATKAAGPKLTPNVVQMREDPNLPGIYHVSTALVTTGTRNLGVPVVKTWEHAVRALAGLSRFNVEHFDMLITDEAGKPLAVVGSFKGATTQTSVYPGTVLMEALRIKGAAKAWAVHNHPSGTPTLSRADEALSMTIGHAFFPSTVQFQGVAAVGRQRDGSVSWSAIDADERPYSGSFAPSDEVHPVPIVERELVHVGTDSGIYLSSPSVAESVARNVSGGRPGLMVLDAQNTLTAWIPVATEDLLYGGADYDRLVNSLANSSASAVIVVSPGLEKEQRARMPVIQTLKARLSIMDVRLLDAMDVGTATRFSMAEKGVLENLDKLENYTPKDVVEKQEREEAARKQEQEAAPAPAKKGPAPKVDQADLFNTQQALFLRDDLTPGGMPHEAVEKLVGQLTRDWLRKPDIHIIEDISEAPEAVAAQYERDNANGGAGTVHGFHFKGAVYLVRSSLSNPTQVREALYHEALGHFGLRGVFGPRLNEILDEVAKARPQLVAKKAADYGLATTPTQARQIILDRAARLGIRLTREEMAERVQKKLDADRRLAAEEVLAELAGSRPDIGWVRRAVAIIRGFLRRAGLRMGLSDSEIIANYLLPARGFVERGNHHLYADEGDAQFSKARGFTTREIQVDGKWRPIEDASGQLVARGFKEQGNFWRFYRDAKTVDEHGRPLPMFHGTPKDFEKFGGRDRFYFTQDPAYASGYADGEGATVMPVYVALQNPLDLRSLGTNDVTSSDMVDFLEAHGVEATQGAFEGGYTMPVWAWMHNADVRRAVRAAGFDGAVQRESNGTGETDAYIAFNPKQIKSALGNSGAFDAEDDRVAFSRVVGDINHRAYTPAQEAAMRNVGFSKDPIPLKQRMQALWQNAGKRLAQGIVDQFAPIKDLSKDAYALLRLSKGSSGAFEVLLKGGQLKLVDGVYDFDETKRGGVIDKLLIPLQGEHHDFMRWVAANRAEQLSAEDRENLFTAADIAALKTLADGQLAFDFKLRNGQTTRSRQAAYRDSLITFNEFHKNTLDLAEQSGLIDGASRQHWEKEFYVPFYRVDEEQGLRGMNIKSGVVRQEAFKRLKGGTQQLNTDLLENTLQNWAHLLDASAKNRAAKATLEVLGNLGHAIEAPEADARQMAATMGKRSSVVWMADAGRQRFFVIDDPMMLAAVSALDFAGFNSPVMKALSGFKHALTVGVTASPFFKVRNLIRDSVQAIGTAPISGNVAGNLAQGWKATARTSDSYFRLLAGGGTIHFGTMYEGSEAKRVQALVEAGVDESTILNSQDKARQFYRKFIEPGIEAYNELGNRGEAVNRAALYQQLRKQGKTHAEASLLARDLMDFSMQGSFSTIRFLTQVVPFMNARLQGLYKLGRAASEDPKRFSIVLGATALLSIALAAGNADDDDWKKREDWDRNNYWWFKFGGQAFRIPKPFEIGAIATVAERGFELWSSPEMTGRRFREQMLALMSDNLSFNPLPQLTKPLLDVYANKDSFTGRPIETMGMERIASQYRYDERTSMVARGTSVGMNAVTGLLGNDALSPVQVDHLIRGYFGWLGSFVVGSADVALRPATGQTVRPAPDYWKQLTGGMVGNLDDAQSRYVTQMYKQSKAIEEAYGTWQLLVRSGKSQEAEIFRQANQSELSHYHQLEAIKRQAQVLTAMRRRVEEGPGTAEAKRDRLREIAAQQDRIARFGGPY